MGNNVSKFVTDKTLINQSTSNMVQPIRKSLNNNGSYSTDTFERVPDVEQNLLNASSSKQLMKLPSNTSKYQKLPSYLKNTENSYNTSYRNHK